MFLDQDDTATQAHVDDVITYVLGHPHVPLYLDLEWDSHDSGLRLSLIQMTTGKASENRPVLVFDAIKIPGIEQRFKSLLESELFKKVMHDPRRDAETLRRRGIQMRGLFDTQIGHWLLLNCMIGDHQRGLESVLQEWLQTDRPNDARMPRWHRTPHAWATRPLPPFVIEYAAADVHDLPALYEAMQRRAAASADGTNKMSTIVKRSQCPRATKKEVAFEFYGYLQAHPNVRESCSEVEVFRSEWASWKLREAVTGSSVAILALLLKRGYAIKQGQTLAFAEPGRAFRGEGVSANAKRAALKDAAERVQESRAQIEQDKFGVTVGALRFDDEVISPGGTGERRMTITNTGTAFRVLQSVRLIRSSRVPEAAAQFKAEIEQRGERIAAAGEVNIELNPGGEPVTLIVRCQPNHVGMCYDTLSLNFGRFTIGRFLAASCGDAALLDELAPTAPYRKQRKQRREDDVDVKEVPPPREDSGDGKPLKPLATYNVPIEWKAALGDGTGEQTLLGGWDLMSSTDDGRQQAQLGAYADHYQRLLWSEEQQLHRDLSQFDLVGQRSTTLEQRGRCMGLRVPGLAEKRPSVLKGDLVAVNLLGESRQRYLGRAEHIQLETVLLRFDNRLHQLGTRVSVEVRFKLGRGPLRVFHQGVAQLGVGASSAAFGEVLFPSAAERSLAPSLLRPPRIDVSRLRFVNRSVEGNGEQRQAVERIVAGEARHVPYIIFGPPGTGKTTTVVEAILQCAKLHEQLPGGFRMLVCAPTNTAADLVCKKVIDGQPNLRSGMLRLMAYSRGKQEVPETVLGCTNWNGEEFASPAPEEVLSKRIIVATLSLAGKLQNTAGVKRGHFDLIFIDESGQAMEPEAVAPVATLLDPARGQLVLAGDPKQLGPVIHHTLAKQLGLTTSLLERLMSRPLYQPDGEHGGGYNSLVLTKLVQNFRSHEVLLRLPNNLFYDGELLACAPELLANCCSRWEGLPQPGVPLVWHGVNGRDEREGNSPSWFNRDECVIVRDWVDDLLRDRTRLGLRETGEDIGIITPYNKQSQKLQFMLQGHGRTVGPRGIKVGSTELFQGQERKVIIISTVRSNADHIGFDIKHNLGFLDNPKRFNVAVTRACSLLIIVGNPAVLTQDPHWGALLRQCQQLGCYRGVQVADAVSPDTDDNNVDDAIAQLDELMLNDDGEPQEASHAFQQEGMEMPEHDS